LQIFYVGFKKIQKTIGIVIDFLLLEWYNPYYQNLILNFGRRYGGCKMKFGKKMLLLILSVVLLAQGTLVSFATEPTETSPVEVNTSYELYDDDEYEFDDQDEIDDMWDDDYIPDGWYDPEYGNLDDIDSQPEAIDIDDEAIDEDIIRSSNHQITTVRQTGVTRRSATFRQGPGSSYATIRTVSGNTNLRITGRSGSWYRVVVNDRTGWLRRTAVARTRQNAVVTASTAHVREGRSTSDRSLTQLSRGHRVTIRRQTGSWSRVNVNGHTGWIRNRDLGITDAMRPARTTANNVAIHTRPNADSSVRHILPRGEQMMVIQRTTDGWSQIRIQHRRGSLRGWVRTNQIENQTHSRRLVRNGPLRSGPGTNFNRRHNLTRQTSVTVRSRVGSWYHVHTTINGRREYGWLHRNNLPTIVTTLTTTDALSYLALVNRDFRLARDFSPNDLRTINVQSIHGTHRMRQTAARQVEDLFQAAANAGHTLIATSGYRSFATQEATHNHWINVMGWEEAIRVSAPPGHSEHQLGLALDISTHGLGGALSQAFSNTAEGRWVANNAHRFGFIIRYPQNREPDTGYIYEPWHIRFVGVTAATEIFNRGLILEEFLGR